MRRVARISLQSLSGLLVAFAICTVAAIGYARLQNLKILSVQSGSMQPAIRRGDAVLVLQGTAHLDVGTIISYRSLLNPKVVITHRIVMIDRARNVFITKGDVLAEADPPIHPDRIIGRVNHSIPLVGFVLNFMRRPVGLLVVVYAPACGLIIGETQRLSRAYTSRQYRLLAYRRLT